MLKAILWDVDGTLAETERDGHLVAFNRAFEPLEVPWRWSETRYGELLAVAGGRERLLHDMERQVRAPPDPERRAALAEQLHRLKNELYAAIVSGGALCHCAPASPNCSTIARGQGCGWVSSRPRAQPMSPRIL